MSYTGPLCYVPPGGLDIPAAFAKCRDGGTANGRRLFGRWRKHELAHLEGGWHYSTKIVYTETTQLDPVTGRRVVVERVRNEVPDRRLHLNDDDPGQIYYEFAQAGHRSWHEKHGTGNVVTFHGLEGRHPAEAYDTHPDHERWKASRA